MFGTAIVICFFLGTSRLVDGRALYLCVVVSFVFVPAAGRGRSGAYRVVQFMIRRVVINFEKISHGLLVVVVHAERVVVVASGHPGRHARRRRAVCNKLTKLDGACTVQLSHAVVVIVFESSQQSKH